jgi:predicted ATPase
VLGLTVECERLIIVWQSIRDISHEQRRKREARLRRDQGKPDEAYELLAPVYKWFTEGFDTRDLKEAKALLDALTP